MNNFYEVIKSYNIKAPHWDDFLKEVSGAHYFQSSLWAEIYASIGWRVGRVLVRQNKRIVAGAQVLFKPMSSIAAVGYIPKGPIFKIDDPVLIETLFTELSNLAQDNRIWLLAIQPPINSSDWLYQLQDFKFCPSKIEMGPIATLLIDLKSDLETILGHMKPRTRYNIRLSSRTGIHVREGTARDIESYYKLVQATASRQQFSIYSKRYFKKIWEVLEPHGQIKLFLSDYKGNVVSAQLVVVFRDTVVNKLSVWSGEFAKLKANEAVYWYAICWSKKHGYSYFDLEGINPNAARSILHNKPIPKALHQSVTSFKVGFGGNVMLLPGVYEHICNQELRLIYKNARQEIATLAEDLTVDLRL